METRNVTSVTIVTPSFNQARFIEQTLRSVVEQGVSAEHIVVDGGSTDGTTNILARYEARLGYWQSRPDRGQTDALNQGMARASGDIVGWINSDDYYLPGALRTVIARFAKPDRPDVVYGNAVTVDESGRFMRENRHGRFSLNSTVALGMDINQQALFWRRELNPGIFPLDVSLRFCMDLELLVKMARRGARFARVSGCLGAFRLHGSSKTSTLEEVRQAEQARIFAALNAEEHPRYGRLRALGARVARRIDIVRDGGLAYAVLGGRLGASVESRRAALAASEWAEREAA
ncbi:glycosyltransferase family 2 protein [Anaeromyxobacter sp. Red801]|uniref:glycosyltransferase family 2 protein n=1 Tax=Anaeromyxobacter sp. Red801 TaxID=3411632 RepID=UPI003B9ED8A8